MSFHANDPVASIQSPLKGSYPMTVRHICVTPGQMLQAGDRVAELLEPSGRWVSIVASELPGQIKAVRLRDGDVLDAPSEICAIYTMRRPKPGEDPLTGAVTRMSLEDLQNEEFNVDAHSLRKPARPLMAAPGGANRPREDQDTGGIVSFVLHHKLLIAASVGAAVIVAGVIVAASMYRSVTEQPHISMDTLWTEMRRSRIAAAEAEHATGDDAFASPVVSQRRALEEARAQGDPESACAGMYVGKELPGRHVIRGVRRITYLDTKRGVGTFVWNKSLEADIFSCASER